MPRRRRSKSSRNRPWRHILPLIARVLLAATKYLKVASMAAVRRVANRASSRPGGRHQHDMLRPRLLTDFTGQVQVLANLSIFIEAARARGDALDHTLLVGPPGVGKTSLAQITARELGGRFRAAAGPAIGNASDVVALFDDLRRGDVLFIDEIHRLRPAVEELFYAAMEDFQLETVDERRETQPTSIKLPKFTLIGATTRAGLLTPPLRQRFGIVVELTFYRERDLQEIVARRAPQLGIDITPAGAAEIARRARGTPRIALRLMRRVHDFAAVQKKKLIDAGIADRALVALGVDGAGLDQADRRYLSTIAVSFSGGPVGIAAVSAALSESADVLEAIEPFLMQIGFLARTPRGRMLTPRAYEHIGLPRPNSDASDEEPIHAARVLH